MVKQKRLLDLGCGANKEHGFIGMDRRKVDGVDIIHDLEDFPYPFEDETCSVVKMSHVIEHISPADSTHIKLMDECWRILEFGGRLLISTPYAGSYRFHQDPTHIKGWNETTCQYFNRDHPFYKIYNPKPWVIRSIFWDVRGDLEVYFEKIWPKEE